MHSQDCAEETESSGGIAFSLQSCYDNPDADEMYCFIYDDEPANPPDCQTNVFDNDSCTYGTDDGSFYIMEEEWDHRFPAESPQYVFVKIESVGDVGPTEASIDNVILEINGDETNVLSEQASTFDNIAWNGGLSPDWSIFSDGSIFMRAYGTLRPWNSISSFADVYGDREGIWIKTETSEIIHKLTLSVSLKFGRGYEDVGRFYEIQVGTGTADDDYHSFQVLGKVVTALTLSEPGNTYWKTFTADWENSAGRTRLGNLMRTSTSFSI